MNDVFESYERTVKGKQDEVDKMLDLFPKVACVRLMQEFCECLKDVSFYFYDARILVCVQVKNLADIEPVLTAFQDQLGVDFDKSKDCPDAGWRQFECSASPWLRVDAELKANTDACRRVIVGYDDPRPIYKFECSEVAQ